MTSTTVVQDKPLKLSVRVHECVWCGGKFAWSDANDKSKYCSREHELKDETYGD